MYETAVDLWKQYDAKYSPQWAADDPRKGLSSEVSQRLTQLDLVLEHLRQSLAAVEGDPGRTKRNAEWIMTAGPRLARGEITEGDFAAGLSRMAPDTLRGYDRAWNEVRLFTEIFYFVAWRLREVLNTPEPRAFPNLQSVEARGVRDVRNVLIQHPEHGRPAPNYQQIMVVTDDGPVLKSLEVIIRGGTGRVTPANESVDRGLFVNAEEFRREMEAGVGRAIACQSEKAKADRSQVPLERLVPREPQS